MENILRVSVTVSHCFRLIISPQTPNKNDEIVPAIVGRIDKNPDDAKLNPKI